MTESIRLGVALSGGGFRATLFHLGVVRFLRDAQLLHQVKHISSISGGSITAAHVTHNWSRYLSTDDKAFCDIANDLIGFVRSDLRGRIVRRLPYNAVIWAWRRSNYLVSAYRHLLQTEIISSGDGQPELSLLTTNLNTGRPWSFDSLGFTEEPAPPVERRIRTSLPVAALRVAASSAFPAFFPSIRLTAKDIGFDNKLFPIPQFFTDGGVFDNLGVRKFMWLVDRDMDAEKTRNGFDIVLLSDAGRGFDRDPETDSSGLFRTVSRSMDITMNRVGTLDIEDALKHYNRFRILSIATEVPKDGNDSILSEEVQRQLKSIRTDLDQFSDLEIRCLVLHGYSVAKHCWSQLLRQAASNDLPSTLCEKLKSGNNSALEKLHPWDPCPEAGSAVFAPSSAVPALQKSQRLKLRLFALSDWVSYINLLIALVFIVAGYSGIRTLLQRDTPDYLAPKYEETVELLPPAAGGRGSTRRTITASIIKLKNDGLPLERGAATVGDRIDAICFSHPQAEYKEIRLTFPGIMKHEYVLKVPLKYDPGLAPQPVSYTFHYVNNLSATSDWIYFVPPFPIETYRMAFRSPVSQPCKHVTVSVVTESGVKKTVLFDSARRLGNTSGFEWTPLEGRLIWSVRNLKPGPAGYRVDFEW